MFRLLGFALVIAATALFLTGRLGGGRLASLPVTLSIADLQGDPGRWEGNHVRVSGAVGNRLAVLGFGGFTLVDEVGREVVVIGHANPAGTGQPMTVDGRFVTTFAAGDVSVSAILVGGG